GGGRADPLIDSLLRIQRAELAAVQAQLHFRDGRSSALALPSLTLARTGHFRRLQLALQLTPRSAPITFAVEAAGDPRRDDFRARGHARFAQIDLTPLLPLASSHGLDLRHGGIDGTVWLQWQGEAFSVRGHLTLPSLDLAGLTGTALPPLTQIQAPFLWRRDRDGRHQLWLPTLRARWGEAPLAFEQLLLERRRGDALLTLRTPRLDLEPLHAALRAGKALPAPLAEALAGLAPRGVLRQLELQLPLDGERSRLRLRSELEGVAVGAWRGAPGVAGLGGFVDTGLDGGDLLLAAHDAALDFPHLYRQPIPLASIRG